MVQMVLKHSFEICLPCIFNHQTVLCVHLPVFFIFNNAFKELYSNNFLEHLMNISYKLFSVPYYNCDMEHGGQSSDNCHIRQEHGGDTFDWSQGRDRTPSADSSDRRFPNGQCGPETGPQNARQGTYYIYVEASERRSGATAR